MEAESNRRRVWLAALTAVALLVGVRVAQLAVDDPMLAGREQIAAESTPELTDGDLALLAMACPQAIEVLPPELRPVFTRVAPPHRLTAAREPAGDWLVDPEEWYAPEDEAAAPDEPPAEEELDPTTDAPAEATEADAQPDAAPDPPAVEPPAPIEPPAREEEAEPSAAEGPQLLLNLPAERSPAEESPSDATPAEEAAPETDPVEAKSAPPEVEPPAAEPAAEPAAKEAEKKEAAPSNEAPRPAPKPAPESLPTPRPTRSTPPTEEVPPPSQPARPRARIDFAPPPGPKPKPLFSAPEAKPPKPAGQRLPAPHSTRTTPLTPKQQQTADESHRELFAKNCYPSARQCGECHKKQYEEWSVSSHAYAFVSPMFHKFEQTITDISRGTVGYFCVRCHSPVAVAMGESRDTPLWEMAEVAREGVTCIACHRVNEHYSKTNGERRIVPGDIHAPVYGGIGGDGVREAIANKSKYKVKTSPHEKGAGQAIHNEGRFFEHLSQAEFCTSCHQVAVHPGIKLEVVWEQYRASPACKKGVTCQHCHMGTVPGIPSPYEIGSIAEVGGKSVNNQRKHANHVFYGPGYSIAHPGVFPFHKDGNRWRIDEWLQFDWRAGWGTDEFEDAVADGRLHIPFPPVWQESDDRCDAREIIDDNIARLGDKRELRQQVMENGTKVDGPYFRDPPRRGEDLGFDYVVTNLNEGHNLLTASLGAQPQLWANVVLIGPGGQRLWETGYLDSNGDLADIHSEDVRHGRIPFDSQLFNLQTMFLITGATGTDREFPLPVNVSIDQVPHLRPGTLPISVLNHPPLIRMESRSLAPLGSKRVKYSIPADRLTQPGHYRLSFRLRSRVEPLYFMRFCNATVEMQRAMNEGILDVHPYSVEFVVE